jgi:hypothetical protein
MLESTACACIYIEVLSMLVLNMRTKPVRIHLLSILGNPQILIVSHLSSCELNVYYENVIFV